MANKGLAKDQKDLSILVTGGAGFIGSHTCVELIQRGYSVVIVDDLSNSSQIAVDRIRKICGIDADDAQLRFYKQNILDREALDAIFAENDVDAIIHFAGFKAVGESVQKPLEYYWNNIAGTLVLCDVARNHGVKNIVFSSSATVYGEPELIPITEECPKHDCTNPYGWTKSMLELSARLVVELLQLLEDNLLNDGVRSRQTLVNRIDGDVLLLAVLLDGLALEVDSADGALAGLAQEGYRPVQYAAHERMQLVLVDALLLGGGAAVVCEQLLWIHRPLSVAPHELAEEYRARGDALDLDDAVVAAAAASR